MNTDSQVAVVPPERDENTAYDEAMADAVSAAYLLGTALARFQTAVERLATMTPKCECGWALGHTSRHRRS